MHDMMVGMKGTSTTISLVNEATAVLQSSVWPLKGAWPLRPTFFTPDVTLHEMYAASTTISYVASSAPARSADASAEGLLSFCLARSIDTRRHRSTLPLCSHTTRLGRQGDLTGGDVICHRSGADPEVEAADEETPRRQRRRVAGRGRRRGPLTRAPPPRARCSPSRGPAVLWVDYLALLLLVSVARHPVTIMCQARDAPRGRCWHLGFLRGEEERSAARRVLVVPHLRWASSPSAWA